MYASCSRTHCGFAFLKLNYAAPVLLVYNSIAVDATFKLTKINRLHLAITAGPPALRFKVAHPWALTVYSRNEPDGLAMVQAQKPVSWDFVRRDACKLTYMLFV